LEVGRIYDQYDIFRQAEGGDEQLVFVPSTGRSMRRSFAVLQQLTGISPFPEHGTAIDIGCGNGAMLKALSRHAPGWSLHGTEQSASTRSQLENIPGFAYLHTGDIGALADSYDVVTLSHSLEHFVDPVAELSKAAQLLSPAGLLIVQVPDSAANLYDILVADHRSHFTAGTLAECARRAGLAHFLVAESLVPKELTLLASPSSGRLAPFAEVLGAETAAALDAPALCHHRLVSLIGWLDAVQHAAREAACSAASFGIFGTSIAGTWLFGGLRGDTAFFVDEDPSRIGKRHEGRPVVSPGDVPAEANVFVCLIPSVALALQGRLAQFVPGRLVLPPPFEPVPQTERTNR
jgi:SAM-dependent methyltransferase